MTPEQIHGQIIDRIKREHFANLHLAIVMLRIASAVDASDRLMARLGVKAKAGATT